MRHLEKNLSYAEGGRFCYHEAEGAEHSEAAWDERFFDAVYWLLAGR